MIKRYSISLLIVAMLTALVSMVATADFGANGTTGSTTGTASEGPQADDQPLEKPLPAPVQGVFVSGTDRKISLSDQSLELALPRGLSSEDLNVYIEPKRAPGGIGSKVFNVWDLRADTFQGKNAVHQFDEALTLTVRFDKTEVRGMDWNSLRIVGSLALVCAGA